MATRSRAGTQSIVRTIELLKALSARRAIGWRLTDLAAHCGLNHSTAHRIINCLIEQRLAQQRDEDRRYVPGPMLYEFALGLPSHVRFQAASQRHLARIARRTGWVGFLYLRSGEDSVCINRVGTYPGRQSFNDIGSRLPLAGSAPGVAMIMALPEPEREALLAANWKTLQRKAAHRRRAYREMWQRSLETGMGYNRGDVVPGIGSLGAAILDPYGRPVAALAASGPLEALPSKRLAEAMQLVQEEAQRMARSHRSLLAELG
jgi:DNA-binding IclR family transcriptional regulator